MSTRDIRKSLSIVVLWRVHTVDHFAEEGLRHLPAIILADIYRIMIHLLDGLKAAQLLAMIDSTHGMLIRRPGCWTAAGTGQDLSMHNFCCRSTDELVFAGTR